MIIVEVTSFKSGTHSRVCFSPENIDGRNLNEMHQCTNKILPRVSNVKIKL